MVIFLSFILLKMSETTIPTPEIQSTIPTHPHTASVHGHHTENTVHAETTAVPPLSEQLAPTEKPQ